MKGILVTGGTGFLGNNFLRFLLGKYPLKTIVNYSLHTYAVNLKAQNELLKMKNFKYVPGDINDKLLFSETLRKFKIETVFHLAASTHVDRSFDYPEEFLRANVQGTFAILEVLRRMKKKPLMIYMGTDEVFGDVKQDFWCRETDIRTPANPYSASKAAAEMWSEAYFHSFKIPIIIVRSMNMFGPYQHPEKLIPKIITKCLTDTPFTLYKGGSERGWIYVEDTSEALDVVAQKGKPGEIYHIPPDAYLTVPEVADIVLKKMGKENIFNGYKGKRLKDDKRYALDATKFTYKLKWKPPTSFDQGIDKTIEWYRKNKWFWWEKSE